MEVPPMTRTEAIKEFFKKAVLPVAIDGLRYCIFTSACIRNGELDLLWLWILCGLPFGIHRMCVWIVPGGGAALFALDFIIGGVRGGVVQGRGRGGRGGGRRGSGPAAGPASPARPAADWPG